MISHRKSKEVINIAWFGHTNLLLLKTGRLTDIFPVLQKLTHMYCMYVLYNVLCVFLSCFFRSWINDKVVWSSFVGLFQQLSFLCLLLCWDTHFVESPTCQLGRFTDLQRCCMVLLWPTNLNLPITNKFKSDSEHDSYYHSFMTKTNWNNQKNKEFKFVGHKTCVAN